MWVRWVSRGFNGTLCRFELFLKEDEDAGGVPAPHER